ncbi:Ser-Thr-rich glycosyl-phosphatidyl-inositol-anchored membrane family-domain-containing protein [Cladorrhinum sp. PSN259]|nr:Ser-Thr-rich glycosyl-phosphatidyl-inositol-anchored membrane family-domain-containing protein [Cladorrhinum sp. PSN259]
MRVLSFLALAAPLVSAIQFEAPFSNSTLVKGQPYSVKWSSVDTDPSTFSLYLVNFVSWPPFYTQLASDISTTDGSFDVTLPCGVDNSWGYQFNAINGTNVYVIHAQTPRFYVSGYCVDEKPLDPIPNDTLEEEVATETCEPVTVTATATLIGSPAEVTCEYEPATVTVTAIVTTVVTVTPGSVETLVVIPTPTTSSTSEETAPGAFEAAVTEEKDGELVSEPEQPATTSAPSLKWEEGSFEPVQTVYSTKYIDLSELEDDQCAC